MNNKFSIFRHRIKQLEDFVIEANKLLETSRILYEEIVQEEEKIKQTFKDANGDKLIAYKDICNLLDIEEWDFQFSTIFDTHHTLTKVSVGNAIKYKLWEVRKQFKYLQFLKEQCKRHTRPSAEEMQEMVREIFD